MLGQIAYVLTTEFSRTKFLFEKYFVKVDFVSIPMDAGDRLPINNICTTPKVIPK